MNAARGPRAGRAPRAAGWGPRLNGFDEADLRLLRVFLAVVNAGGLSAATVELQLDLSTVSRQFKELESLVGARLARRGRAGFTLTPAGEALQRASTQLLAAIEVFALQRQQIAGDSAPQLRIGVVDALLTGGGGAPDHPRGLAQALAACGAALPGLQVQLQSAGPQAIQRAVSLGELDCGVLAASEPAAGLEHHRLYAEANSLFVAPGHPWYAQAARDPGLPALQQASLVVDPYWAELPHAELAGWAGLARPGARADSVEGVALLVCTGLYAGFLPDHLVQATQGLQALRRVCPARYSYQQDIVLVCRRGQVEPAVRTLLRAWRA